MSKAKNVLSNSTTDAAATLEEGRGQRQAGVGFYLRLLSRDKLAMAALVFLVVLALAAVFAPIVTPFSPNDQSLSLRNSPLLTPAEDGGFIPHLLGTDQLGRDLLTRLIYGARVSVAVGVASVFFSGVVGVLLGLVAGYYRGFMDDLIMRLVDLQMGFPSLLLALVVLYALGASILNVIFVLAVTRWMVYARITRSLVFQHREEMYVEAAQSLGCSDRRVLFKHILPNLLSPILVLATLEVATMILTEASLSFLGLGIQPPDSSWGLMLAQGREYVRTAWWLIMFPGLFILLTTLSLNLVATWARTVTDPTQRWRLLVSKEEK